MKRLILALCLLVASAAHAAGDVATTLIDNSGTDGEASMSTSGCHAVIATVSVTSGSPDGTVTGYVLGPKGEPITVFTYATPTTTKSYRGPAISKFSVVLSGNTTGKVTVTGVCK